MELKQLRSLITLADSGSIASTAEKLHLSPAAIHKQLKVLEDELGARLYEKIGRRLQLTQAAEILIPYVKEALLQHDAAMSAVAEWKGMKRGLIRVGAGPAMSSYILPPLLKRFRRGFPDVELLVQSGNTVSLLESLGRGLLDLTLLISPDLVEGPDFQVHMHRDFEMVLVSHGRHIRRRCRLAELEKFPFILYRKGSRMEESVDRYFAANNFRPRVIMRFDNAEAIKAMIQTGLGISMLPLWIIDAELKSGRLAAIRQEEPPLFSKIALLSRRSSYMSQVVRAFIDETRTFEWNSPRLATASLARSGRREATKRD